MTLQGLLPVHVDDGKNPLSGHFRKDPMVELSSVEHQEMGQPVALAGMQFTEVESCEWLDQNNLHSGLIITYRRHAIQA